DRLGDMIDGEVLGAEHFLEAADVTGNGTQPFDAGAMGGGGVLLARHLDGIGERSLGLVLESGGPAVPELGGAVGPVDDGRGAAASLESLDAHRYCGAVGKRLGRLVATRTRDGAVGGQPWIEVEQPAQV